MVGLEGIARGWTFIIPSADGGLPNYGYGTVSYEISARSATLAFDGHKLTFRDGSRSADVDGQPVLMKSAAIWDPVSEQMIVPLAALTDALHLATSWDPNRCMLSVTGAVLTHYIDSSDYGDLVGHEGGDEASLVPETARLRTGALHGTVQFLISRDHRGPRASLPPIWLWLELTVRNVSGHDIREGGDWINVTALARSGVPGEYVDVLPPAVVLAQKGSTPPMPTGGTRTLTLPVDRQWNYYTPLCIICRPIHLARDLALVTRKP